MKLLAELNESVEVLTEAEENGKKNLFVKGIFMQAEIKNKNGRLYPINTMKKEVDRYVKECVSTKSAWGELSHPSSPQINPDRVSHLITELKQEGSNFVGKARILDTPTGNIVKGLIDGGGQVGISSRALGTLVPNNEGTLIVQEDFKLSTAGDIVLNPSAPDAILSGIMESADWIYNEKLGWQMIEAMDDARKYINENYKKIDETKLLSIWDAFLKSI